MEQMQKFRNQMFSLRYDINRYSNVEEVERIPDTNGFVYLNGHNEFRSEGLLLRSIEGLFEEETRKVKLTEIPEKCMLFFEINMMKGT